MGGTMGAKHLSIALFIASACAAPQGIVPFNGDPSMAKIIQEQRFNTGVNNGDMRFGHAVQQEDGVIIKEETSGNNERIGEYQYVGDDGKLYTVGYSAGVNGFRILNGDHIPSGGQNAAAAVAKGAGTEELEEYDYAYYDDTKLDSPFVNPHDPTHQKPSLLSGNLAGHLAGIFAAAPTTPRPLNAGPTTSAPLRIFPKGNVQLERFPEGFNFAFKSE